MKDRRSIPLGGLEESDKGFRVLCGDERGHLRDRGLGADGQLLGSPAPGKSSINLETSHLGLHRAPSSLFWRAFSLSRRHGG